VTIKTGTFLLSQQQLASMGLETKSSTTAAALPSFTVTAPPAPSPDSTVPIVGAAVGVPLLLIATVLLVLFVLEWRKTAHLRKQLDGNDGWKPPSWDGQPQMSQDGSIAGSPTGAAPLPSAHASHHPAERAQSLDQMGGRGGSAGRYDSPGDVDVGAFRSHGAGVARVERPDLRRQSFGPPPVPSKYGEFGTKAWAHEVPGDDPRRRQNMSVDTVELQ